MDALEHVIHEHATRSIYAGSVECSSTSYDAELIAEAVYYLTELGKNSGNATYDSLIRVLKDQLINKIKDERNIDLETAIASVEKDFVERYKDIVANEEKGYRKRTLDNIKKGWDPSIVLRKRDN